MEKESPSVFTIIYVGRVLTVIAGAGFALRGVVVPDDLNPDDPDAGSWHVLVWMCFASLSLGIFCVLGALRRLADRMDLE